MPVGQLFVGRPVPVRHALVAMCLPLALALAACGTSNATADEQAALAEQALGSGDLVAANIAIGEAITNRGDDPRLYLLSAKIKIAQGNYAEAYEAYQTVLALDPNNFEALVSVAVMARSLGDPARGRDAMDLALAIDPTQIDVLMSKGMLVLEEKNYAEAAALAERIIAAHPSDPSGYVLKSRTLTLQGKNAEGFKVLRDTVSTLGNSVMVSTALLEAARAEGDVATMREQYALIASEKPDSVELALDEINLLYKIGETAEARRAGGEMLRRFGEDAIAMNRLRALWTEYDREPIGAEDLAAVRDGDGQDARLMVARFLLEGGRLAEAGQLVQGAQDPRLAGLGARIAARQGNPGGAMAARAILAKDTTNCEALGAVAEWDLAQGKLDAAIRSAQVLATQCTDRIDGYVLQARAYEAAGRPAAVERVFRDGIEAHAADPELTRRFADWLFAKGRGPAAVSITAKLTKVAPNRASSWRLYGTACQRANRGCQARAAQGLAAARTDYSLEALGDASAASILLGRQWD